MNNKDMPAYPAWCHNSEQQLYGVTKLEAFTMAALQGLCANTRFASGPDVIATLAVDFAEASLAELEKRND